MTFAANYARVLRYAEERRAGEHPEEHATVGAFARAIANGDHTAMFGLADWAEENDHPLAPLLRRLVDQRPPSPGHQGSRFADDAVLLRHPVPNQVGAEWEYPHHDFGGDEPDDVFEDRRPYTTASVTFGVSPSGNHRARFHFGDNSVRFDPQELARVQAQIAAIPGDTSMPHPLDNFAELERKRHLQARERNLLALRYHFREYSLPVTPEEMTAVAEGVGGRHADAFRDHLNRVLAVARGESDPQENR